MKLSRFFRNHRHADYSLSIALLLVLLALPGIVSAQMTDPDGSRRDSSRISNDFMLFNSQTAVVPDDFSVAIRPCISSVQNVSAKFSEIYAFLYGRVQLDGSIGMTDTMRAVSLGAKVYLVDFLHTKLSLRYRFDMFGGNFEFKDPMRFHHASLMFSTWLGQLMLTVEGGGVYSTVTGFERSMYHFGIQHPIYNKGHLIIDVQNYSIQDTFYGTTAMLGYRYHTLDNLWVDFGLMHRMNDDEGEDGIFLGLVGTF